MKRKVGMILIAVVLVVTLVMAGCAKPGPAPGGKTLKIGSLVSLEFPLGVDCQKQLDALVPAFNKAGGLVIGGERYNIDLILYNSKMDAETGKAAVERLVHQDKVKFILGDETADAWIPVTEENKVLVAAISPSPTVLNPDYKYFFQAGPHHTQAPTIWGWLTETHPELKTVGAVFPDRLNGHAEADHLQQLCNTFGQKLVVVEFYPPDTTDFSAIATKVKAANPDIFTTCAGGTLQDSLAYKALHESGWRGQICAYVGISPGAMAKVISLDMVEGMLAPMVAPELDSPPPAAQELRDVYSAKYGDWDNDNPTVLFIDAWYCMLAGLEQAQSLDPDKVAAVIGNGMKYESGAGPAMMISRPDVGNPRTIDTLFVSYIGKITGGDAELIRTISLEEGLKYVAEGYGW